MFYFGTSGWYYDDWVNNFYPKDIEKNEWLIYYSQRFNSVEVNASFYRLPFKNMVKGWNNKTPDDFLFTFKGSRLITHNKKLKNVDESLNRFFKRIKMSDKIGVVLWQLPPFLKKDLNLLENFFTKLDSNIKQCIEFRHKSWFEEDVFDLLRRYNVAYCIISAPGLPSTIKVTSDFAYFRWHGINDWYKYNYSKNELNGWASKIKQLDVKDVFGYFNNDYNGYAPQNCMVLKELLK